MASIVLLGLLLVLYHRAMASNYHWEAHSQFTPTTSARNHQPKEVAFGRTEGTLLHVLVREWKSGNPTRCGGGLHLEQASPGSSWTSTAFTPLPDDTSDVYYWDLRFVVDADDYINTVFEAHHVDSSMTPMSGTELHSTIGYKCESDAGLWADTADPVFIATRIDSGDTLTVEAHSPRIALQENGGAPDSLHAVWGTADPEDPNVQFLVYSKKALSDDSDEWQEPAYVTTKIHPSGTGGSLVVDDDHRVHFFATQRTLRACDNPCTEPDTVRVLHFMGTSPGEGEPWVEGEEDDFTVETLDTWLISHGEAGGEGEESDSHLTEATTTKQGTMSEIHVAWVRRDTTFTEVEKVIVASTLNLTTLEWSPELASLEPLSPTEDGYDAGGPRVTVDEETGEVHIFWVEGGDGGRILHVSSTDPTSGSWSLPFEVVADRRTWSKRPYAVAKDGIVTVSFASMDNDVGGDGRWQGRMRMGHVMSATGVATDDTVHWSGEICLDRDFTIAEGGALVLDAGSAVCCGIDSAQVGMSQVELNVEGQLLAEGTAEDIVRLRGATVSDGPGSWYGVRFVNPDEQTEISRLTHADIAQAINGISLDGQKVMLDSCTFESGANSAFDILMKRDTTIPEYETWDILGPTRVGAVKNGTSDLELLIEGQLLARGTSDTTEVTFTSAEDPPEMGDWRGLRFDHEGLDDNRLSELRHCRFEYPTMAAQLDSLMGTMFDVSFVETEGDFYFDRDIVVPPGATWSIGGPARFVAEADSSVIDLWEGLDDVSDIIVRGTLYTFDDVKFTSTDEDGTNGDDWGGLYFPPYAGSSSIADADIGYAQRPVFSFYADSLTVRNSAIHHFGDSGGGTLASDAIFVMGGHRNVFASNTIERGTGLDSDISNRGIVVVESAPTIQGNTLSDLSSTGIYVANSYTYCLSHYTETESLRVVGNDLTGPGQGEGAPERTGIEMLWGCGADAYRLAEISGNEIQHWNADGLSLDQCQDVQVECNKLHKNDRAVWVNGDPRFTVTPIRFKQNRFDSSATRLFVTNDVARTLLGGTGATGRNSFFETDHDTSFISIVADTSDTLAAPYNLWKSASSVWTVTDSILSRIDRPAGAPDPDVSSPQTSENGTCLASMVGGSAHRGPGEAAAADEEGDDVVRSVGEGTVPRVTGLGSPRPTPFTDKTVFVFAIAGEDVKSAQVEVFDVTGRRVRSLVDQHLRPGFYRTIWDGRDQGGRGVAAGVYFVRMIAGDVSQVRKVVLVR